MKKANELDFDFYWNSIPIGKENAVDYPTLCLMWGGTERAVRVILHELSCHDNGDDYVLIRSSKSKGFYKTAEKHEIIAYRKKCLNKGRSLFAPIKKINRVIRDAEDLQGCVFNNIKAIRNSRGIKQTEVVSYMKQFDKTFDAPTLSKLENGVFLPTPYQCVRLAALFDCTPSELVTLDLYAADVFGVNNELASREKAQNKESVGSE